MIGLYKINFQVRVGNDDNIELTKDDKCVTVSFDVVD